MSFLKFDNVTGTTTDIKLSDVVRFAIRNGYIDLGASASVDAPDTAIATREDIKFSGGHMFQIIEHNGPLATIPLGTIPANGQKVYEYLYPQQYAKIIAGHQFAVTEVLWNSGVSGNVDVYKGCWSLGGEDEYGKWVRAPKLNADTGYRAPFLRGSQIGVDAGKLVLDQMQGHKHRTVSGSSGEGAFGVDFGVDTTKTPGMGAYASQGLYYSVHTSKSITDGVNGTPREGIETAPRYHGVIMCIRMFGTVSNPGSLDAAQLATDLAVANVKIQQLEGQSQLAATGNAVMTGVDNKLVFTGIVGALKLEKGDVVSVVAGLYNKLHTVESILNDNEIIVNYEHCGGRGNGTLKLQDYNGPVTITRIVKWYNAASGLGQALVPMTGRVLLNTDYQNTTGRQLVILGEVANGQVLRINISGNLVGGAAFSGSVASFLGTFVSIVDSGATYRFLSEGALTIGKLFQVR